MTMTGQLTSALCTVFSVLPRLCSGVIPLRNSVCGEGPCSGKECLGLSIIATAPSKISSNSPTTTRTLTRQSFSHPCSSFWCRRSSGLLDFLAAFLLILSSLFDVACTRRMYQGSKVAKASAKEKKAKCRIHRPMRSCHLRSAGGFRKELAQRQDLQAHAHLLFLWVFDSWRSPLSRKEPGWDEGAREQALTILGQSITG